MEPVIWRDGALIEYSQATVHVMSHMVARGSQVFDVMAAVDGDDGPSVFGLRPHVARFVRSMQLMSMDPIPAVGQIEAAIAETVLANCSGSDAPLPVGPWLVKVIGAWEEAAGLLPASPEPSVYVAVSSFGPGPSLGTLPEPARLKTAAMPKIPASVLPPGLKVAAGYTPALRHMMQAKAEGFDHVVCRDINGDLAESVASSLLVVADGKIVAPPLDTVLDGITRRALLDAAAFLDIPTDVRPVRWREVTEADELVMTSTTKSVLPVGVLDERTLPAPGPITLKLGDVMSAVLEGRHDLSERWLTPLTGLSQ